MVAALLLSDETPDRVRDMLTAEDFFRDQNGWIFGACMAIADRGDSVTIPTVAHELERAGRLDPAGGEPYLVDVAGKYFTAVGVEAHARIVARDALYRRLIQAGSQIASIAYEGGPDAEAAIALAEDALTRVRSGLADAAVASMVRIIDGMSDDGDEVQRITSGFRSIDRMTRGFKRGQTIVVGGRQDSGKSALMMSMAYRQAMDYSIPSLYVPLEDTPEEVVVRLAGDIMGAGWDYMQKQATSRAISNAEWMEFRARWPEALSAARTLVGDLIHYPAPGRVPSNYRELETLIRVSKRRAGIQVAYIDYLDVLPKTYRRGQSTADVVSEQMTNLTNLAVKLDIAIVIGSQVSNEEAKTEHNPPRWTGLLDSGAKARNARGILMVGGAPDSAIAYGRRPLLVTAAKVKGYAVERSVTATDSQGRRFAALYLDLKTGTVREVGD